MISRRVKRAFVSATLAVLVVTPSASLRAQDSLPKVVIGCWAITRGAWKPPMSIGDDTIYSTPPPRIEIQALKGTVSFEKQGWRVRSAPGTSARPRSSPVVCRVGDP